jgi:hypothetical protein
MITVERNIGCWSGLENCALCGNITSYWTMLPDRTPGEQVACCKQCGRTKEPSDVPTKKAWFDANRRKT